MELRHLRYFMAVAEQLSFRRAAESLHMAQPPLSYQIAALENELRVPLFIRSKRRVQLTDAGRALQELARGILNDASAAAEIVQAVARGELGSLRIACTRYLDPVILPRVLRELSAKHPGIHVIPRVGSKQKILADLEAGLYELVIMRLPVQSSLLVWHRLKKDLLAAALPPSHPLARRRRVNLTALKNDPFIIVGSKFGGWGSHVEIAACHAAGFTPSRIEEADGFDSVIALVAAGRGVALLPASLSSRFSGSKDIVIAELADLELSVDCVLVGRKEEDSYITKLIQKSILEVDFTS